MRSASIWLTSRPLTLRSRRRGGAAALVLSGACWLAASGSDAAPTQPGQLVNPITPATNCEFCHGYENALADELEPEYAPLRTWQGTMMANSARDPVFWAGVAVADADSPGDTVLCVRCHSPRAFLEGNGNATAFDQLTADQQLGVECELCHRMMDDGVTPAGNAQYVIDDQVLGFNVPRRGPWSYDDGVPEPPHSHLPDTYLGTSRLCGTCHDVTTNTERVDDAGVGMGMGFNEQRTYSEWLGSARAVPGPDFASCQDCHMPAVADKPGCSAHINQYTHATGGRRHDLVGANRFMVEVMKSEYGSAGANLIDDQIFDNALAAMDQLLPTAATLEVQGPSEVDLAEGLSDLQVTVTNNTGHKLPTGYSEGRVMWLEVVAEYGGQVVYGSGRWDAAAGTIEEDPQLRTYRAIGERWSDGTTLHLLLNDHWQEDTRIPPRGLQPNVQTDPVGGRYVLQPDGTWPHFDAHGYAFPAAPEIADVTPEDAADDELSVTVRLRYLVNTPEYVDFLANNAGEAGATVETLFDLAGGAPALVVTEQTLAIPIVHFAETTGTSGSESTSGSSGSTSGEATGTGNSTTAAATTTSGPMPPSDSTGRPSDDTTSPSSGSDDTAASDGGSEGCACRSSGRSDLAGAWLPWVVLGLGARRRRARRA